eukprot:100393-Chlamydomonas_euryale.AAC.2
MLASDGLWDVMTNQVGVWKCGVCGRWNGRGGPTPGDERQPDGGKCVVGDQRLRGAPVRKHTRQG